MTKRIKEDHDKFRRIISGRSRKALKKLIKSGSIIKERPKGGRLIISIPEIEQPYFALGDNGEGVGRGEGKEGDVVGRDKGKGKGKGGSGAGDGEGEGILISVDLEEVLQFMEKELNLPNMKPKPNELFEETKIKYDSISKVGINSLRHNKRTMREAIKRLASTKNLDNMKMVPGFDTPIRVINPIQSDLRYRQYKEIRIPSSNAVIFFARDCSGSMDTYRCDIVSDMAWWLDCWIRRFYDKVDTCYFVHDVKAWEVDQNTFFNYRFGGGTLCSSAFEAIAQQLENRYPPNKFNIYVFYFSDGDNALGDNEVMLEIMKTKLNPKLVNLIGMAQICPYQYNGSVQSFLNKAVEEGDLDSKYFKTAMVGNDETDINDWGYTPNLSDEERNYQILEGIRNLLGSN